MSATRTTGRTAGVIGAVGALSLFATPALADNHTATVSVLHGIPETPVDVYANGEELIGDFTPGTDHLRLAGFATFAAVLAATTERAGSAVIDLGSGDSLTLTHVPKAALLADDVLLG